MLRSTKFFPCLLALGVVAGWALATPCAAAGWPAGFAAEKIAAGWTQPTGIVCAPDGRAWIWEKAGRVWTVANGVKSAQPVLDLSEEVGNWRDHGLLGFALDPAFAQNGRVYLLYVVDAHHLQWFGTPTYGPTQDWYFRDTIGRLTRYTLDLSGPAPAVVPGSRTVLLGESASSGIPITNQSHGVGSLVFGEDGTLFVSAGDGASYVVADAGGPAPGSSNSALADGILRAKEDVGAYRAQLVDSLNGKILRIDPVSGDGVASNPFFDPAQPRAPRSRVWALGLRNPYRFALQRGTGSTNPAAGDPGTLWIGDVGWSVREEIDVCDGPGKNFGWPLYEGLEPQPLYAAQTTANPDAPNPLFGAGCAQAYFRFRDLLVEDAHGTPSWPNPCDPSQQVPSSVARFRHERPVLDWLHDTGPARARTYVQGQAAIALVGAPGSPLAGPQFAGNSCTGGAWVDGTAFPLEYRDQLYFADYVGGWIRRLTFDPLGQPEAVLPFGSGGEVASIVHVASEPGGGALWFLRYEPVQPSEVWRVVPSANLPPQAEAGPAVSFGPVPLPVQFSSASSTDPEGLPLACRWDFGDGRASDEPSPLHVYDGTSDVSAQATIVARVQELAPPQPLGGGSQDPNVIRDGQRPAPGSAQSSEQYDTFHFGEQGSLDWIGYAFGAPRTFVALEFQEGIEFSNGGWFEDLTVQVGDDQSWSTVSSLAVSPPYPGANGVSFESFRLDFAPISGTRVRIVGTPGGSSRFVSVGELRAIALDPPSAPLRRDVTLTVTDAGGASASANVLVSLNNTPPLVQIASPLDGSLYALGAPQSVPLQALLSDAEHAPGELACSWQTALHHGEHSHPEPPDLRCATSALLTPEGCNGEEYHFEVTLTVTDAAGLATTAVSRVWPACVPETLCAGDGSDTPCPCASGQAGRGCENSRTTGGGLLTVSGNARAGADTLLATARHLPPSTFVLFLQADEALAGGLGATFGDGLRCAGGEVRRLAQRQAVAGVVELGAPMGGVPLSVSGAIPAQGGVRVYQVWYRDAHPYCTAATYNLTNGVRVTWIP